MSQVVRAVLEQHARLNTPVASLRDNDNLHEHGFDSMAMVNVMLALEDMCDLAFPEEVMTRQSFASIAALDAVLQRLSARKDVAYVPDIQTNFVKT